MEAAIAINEQVVIYIYHIDVCGGIVLSTYKTQPNIELGIWLFYQYLKILLTAFIVLLVMAQASRLFSVELRSEDAVGRNRFFRKVSIPYTEMVWVSMGKMLIVDCMVIRTNSLKRIYAPFDLDGFQDLSDKIDAKLKHRNASSSDF
ncbi:hypothetical protein [Aeromonas hydrophila]|uniref:hypothetical protein n=1 Tax=Aeromonas hydrophila TaxID=644 RepID=UPI001F5CDC0D|nr:hypothetical protein [Aeromonas hydrophila]UMQ45629.1 hypothetical protein MJ573_18370 [Aeromonas hydrophila]